MVAIWSGWVNFFPAIRVNYSPAVTMRHDFASQLAMKGVPIHSIQKLMCHASIEMTQRYAHLSQNSLENAVTLLEE